MRIDQDDHDDRDGDQGDEGTDERHVGEQEDRHLDGKPLEQQRSAQRPIGQVEEDDGACEVRTSRQGVRPAVRVGVAHPDC